MQRAPHPVPSTVKPRSPSTRPTSPRTCSRSSTIHLLDLGGTYGDPNAGDPIQYDELRIEHDQGDVEIVVHNRAVLLFTTDSEAPRHGTSQRRPVASALRVRK